METTNPAHPNSPHSADDYTARSAPRRPAMSCSTMGGFVAGQEHQACATSRVALTGHCAPPWPFDCG